MMVTAVMGMGLFAAPAMIAGIVLRPQVAMSPGPGVIVTGLVLHMLLSMMFGVLFAVLVARVRTSTVGLRLVYGIALWIMNFYIFGLVLGAIVARSGKSLPVAA